ncbi:MAG: FG-GAP repeat protein [Flavobacteriales bacterium]|nr:FG-GAP repeat protein [Flavobacteriales bacterium]
MLIADRARFLLTILVFTWKLAICQSPYPVELYGPLSSGSTGDQFGRSVAISGDYAFVSATPKVHVYNRWEGGPNAWGWVQSIEAPDGFSPLFGTGVYAWTTISLSIAHLFQLISSVEQAKRSCSG